MSAPPDQRARLAHALDVAWSHPPDVERVAGLPAQLRTLGLGQVLVMLLRQDRGRVGRPLVAWLVRLGLATDTPRANLDAVLTAWEAMGERLRAARIEEETVHWAVDLKLMLALHGRPEGERDPTLAGAEPGGPAWRERKSRAALAAFKLEGCHGRIASLPGEIQRHGLLRTLALLARDERDPSEIHPEASAYLSRSIRERLAGMPVADIPFAPQDLARLLVDPERAALAHTLEAEALAWTAELKTFVTALAKGSP